MRILTEMMRDKTGEAEALDKIDREVIEIDELVAELLAASRMDFSALTVKELSAVALAEQAMEKAAVDPSKLALEGSPGKIRGDATLLVRAIANLLENAKKHAGGALSLTIAANGDRVRFVVEDEGPGLGEGEATRIFEPFYRGRTQGSGVGLGLALVKRIAEAHGGGVFARTRDGGGASIGFEIATAGPTEGATLAPITRCG
jgi:signal transduction histidine kinase